MSQIAVMIALSTLQAWGVAAWFLRCAEALGAGPESPFSPCASESAHRRKLAGL